MSAATDRVILLHGAVICVSADFRHRDAIVDRSAGSTNNVSSVEDPIPPITTVASVDIEGHWHEPQRRDEPDSAMKPTPAEIDMGMSRSQSAMTPPVNASGTPLLSLLVVPAVFTYVDDAKEWLTRVLRRTADDTAGQVTTVSAG